jgi:hypothetical protein
MMRGCGFGLSLFLCWMHAAVVLWCMLDADFSDHYTLRCVVICAVVNQPYPERCPIVRVVYAIGLKR